jgi:uncharacterized protein with GYD domain
LDVPKSLLYFDGNAHAVGGHQSRPLFWVDPNLKCIFRQPSNGGENPLFITYVSYSNAGIKGIMDKPIDRTEPIRAVVEKAGGKLIAAYMTTGPHDVVLVTEQADGSDAVAIGMAAAASGAVAKIETVRAWTLGEFKGIAEKAS